MKAIWNNTVIAESTDTVLVEGNHYFPPESLNREFISDSKLNTTCPYKGTASYYDITVDGDKNADAVWYYPSTRPGFENIEGRVAFWKGVQVVA